MLCFADGVKTLKRRASSFRLWHAFFLCSAPKLFLHSAPRRYFGCNHVRIGLGLEHTAPNFSVLGSRLPCLSPLPARHPSARATARWIFDGTCVIAVRIDGSSHAGDISLDDGMQPTNEPTLGYCMLIRSTLFPVWVRCSSGRRFWLATNLFTRTSRVRSCTNGNARLLLVGRACPPPVVFSMLRVQFVAECPSKAKQLRK